GENARPGPVLAARASHAAYYRRAELIRSAGVPIHDLADVCQRSVGHDGAVLVLDPIEQLHDIASADGADRLRSDTGIDEPFERDAAIGDGAKLFAFASEICVGNRFECVLSQRNGAAALLQWIA